MKKKWGLTLVALFAVVALSACSNNKKTVSSSSASSSSTVVSKSSSTGNSSSTEESSTETKIKESTIEYMTDKEIEAIKTTGDYKEAFTSLTDSYVADFDELIAQVPEAAQKQLEPYRKQVVEAFEQQKETLDTQLSAMGDDNTALPAASKNSLVSTLKQARDQLKQAMETARSQAQSLMK